MIRRAGAVDSDALQRCVLEAYAPYVARMEQPPGPMLEDYAAVVAHHEVWVAEIDGEVVGGVVLIERPDHLLLDNVAVRPDRHGEGIGRALISHAERRAADRRYREIRLYTHEVMTENLALYARTGWEEFDRLTERGYRRVYFRKRIDVSD